ncbi:MAG TPA: amidase, partial [Anaerolineales bacterium]|nr:amidase [Anaerolineales bacterium]
MNQLELTRAFRAGELSIADYISQIESFFEECEPSVLAFLPEENRFERLRKDAEKLVASFPDPSKRPPLFGMLFGVKDIFHADGFTTQAGSKLPAEDIQGSEAVSVTRLKNAGALVMGKTVTTEFAYFFPGPTRNPHNRDHTPGGSSSGSAAAVGAGLCPLALGTQTIGSLVRPAAFCGVVTLKPTSERIPRDGVIPLSPSLDHIGFFTPDISTAKQVVSVLIHDWNLDAMNRKPTLGIPEGPYLTSASSEALACFNAICDSLSNAGYQLRRVPVMDDFQEIRARHDVIMSANAANVHKAWFDKYENFYSPKFTELIKRGQLV